MALERTAVCRWSSMIDPVKVGFVGHRPYSRNRSMTDETMNLKTLIEKTPTPILCAR